MISHPSQDERSGDSVVDNTLDCQSRDRKIDTLLLRSFGLLTEVPSLYDLVIGVTLNPSSLTPPL